VPVAQAHDSGAAVESSLSALLALGF